MTLSGPRRAALLAHPPRRDPRLPPYVGLRQKQPARQDFRQTETIPRKGCACRRVRTDGREGGEEEPSTFSLELKKTVSMLPLLYAVIENKRCRRCRSLSCCVFRVHVFVGFSARLPSLCSSAVVVCLSSTSSSWNTVLCKTRKRLHQQEHFRVGSPKGRVSIVTNLSRFACTCIHDPRGSRLSRQTRIPRRGTAAASLHPASVPSNPSTTNIPSQIHTYRVYGYSTQQFNSTRNSG